MTMDMTDTNNNKTTDVSTSLSQGDESSQKDAKQILLDNNDVPSPAALVDESESEATAPLAKATREEEEEVEQEHPPQNGNDDSDTGTPPTTNNDSNDSNTNTTSAAAAAAAVENEKTPVPILATKAVNTAEEEKKTDITPNNNSSSSNNTTTTTTKQITQYAMDLNVAYEALEQIRQANVAIEFGGRQLLPKECLPCLRDQLASQQHALTMTQTDRQSRFKKFLAANKPTNVRPAAPCLTCGTPVCPRHRCQVLKRENINICTDCSVFFSLDSYLARVTQSSPSTTTTTSSSTSTATTSTTSTEEDANNNDNATTTTATTTTRELTYDERKQHMNQMLDVYDRVLLILQYSSRYIHDIATALENNTKRNNQIGFGSSATGFVSGIAGVAAAVTIFTPVGPPLLIASILFGGGATAASAGSEAVNYHCSANKMCDTIIALHGMLHSISRLTLPATTATATSADGEDHESDEGARPLALPNSSNHSLERGGDNSNGQDPSPNNSNKNNNSSRPSSPKQRKGIRDDSTKQASARNWTRAAGNALKPLTGGALSAVSVVAEAREMRATLDKINAGNPCAKAETLREIGSEIAGLPSTTEVAEACPKFFRL